MSKFVVTDQIYQALYDGGVISAEPKNVRRCVIDLERGSAARIYLEMFADDSLIDVALDGGLRVLYVVPDEKPA